MGTPNRIILQLRRTNQLILPAHHHQKTSNRYLREQLNVDITTTLNRNQNEDIYLSHHSLRTRIGDGAESLWTASLCFTLPLLRLQPNRSGCCSISRKCALRGVFCYCSRRSGNDWYCFDWGRVDDSDEYGSTYYDCDD